MGKWGEEGICPASPLRSVGYKKNVWVRKRCKQMEWQWVVPRDRGGTGGFFDLRGGIFGLSHFVIQAWP